MNPILKLKPPKLSFRYDALSRTIAEIARGGITDFVRSTTATCWCYLESAVAGDSQVLQIIPATVPRFVGARFIASNNTWSNLLADGSVIPESTLKGVQIEVASTNLILYSDDFTQASWEKGATVTVTTVSIVNPAGGTTCSKILANGTGFGFVRKSVYAATTGSFNSSIFVKKGNSTYVSIRGRSTIPYQDYFNFDTETFTNNSGNSLSFIKYPNGWYRIISGRTTGEAVTYFSICPVNSLTGVENQTFTGEYFYAWGGQATIQPMSASYIPTTAATVTRNADVPKIYQVLGNINRQKGTLYLEFTPQFNAIAGFVGYLFGSYTDANNFVGIRINGTSIEFVNKVAGTEYVASKALSFVAGTTYKLAVSYGAGLRIAINGVAGVSSSSLLNMNWGTTYQFGADGNSLNQPFTCIRYEKAMPYISSPQQLARMTK